MRKYIILTIAIILSLQLLGQTQKTFVKSFPNPSTTITVNLNAPIEFKEWNQPYVRILTKVILDNGNSNVLTAIAKSGRYRLLAKQSEKSTEIYRSTALNPLKYKGQLLKEQISYTIFVPKNAEVNVVGDPKNEL